MQCGVIRLESSEGAVNSASELQSGWQVAEIKLETDNSKVNAGREREWWHSQWNILCQDLCGQWSGYIHNR